MLNYTSYIRNKTESPKKLVIMFHGYGSNKNDLINLAPELSKYLPSALFISPDAPFQFEGMMQKEYRQWFSLLNRSQEILLREIRNVEKIVLDFILAQLKQNNLGENDLCLFGFSQGTMLILYLVLECLIKPKLLLGYSGKVIKNTWKCKLVRQNTKIMLVHGKEDDIITIKDMEITKETLLEYGFETNTYISRYLAHGIDIDGVNQGGSFLKNNF